MVFLTDLFRICTLHHPFCYTGFMNSQQIAWAGGLFEGEGCISQNKERWTLEVGSTDEDVISKFAEIVEVGRLWKEDRSKSSSYNPAHNPLFYRWRCGRKADVLYVLNLLEPWLGKRRGAKAREAIVAIENHLNDLSPLSRKRTPSNVDHKEQIYSTVKPLRRPGLFN